jgi:hypothetical protein
MAINTQKLLPSAKTSSSLAKANVGKILSGSSIKTKKIDTKKLVGPLVKRDEPGEIVNILTDIDTRLKLILGEEQRQKGKKQKEKEKAEFQKEEQKLEAPKEAKKFKLPGLAAPGMSFLDRIKRFLFFTALGWLFTKFQDQLPKLEGVLKTITQVYGIAENIFKFLLGTFVNFIDRGYKTYDKVRDLAKSIGGEKAQQDFDKLSGKLNEYINYVLIGGMALTGAINSFNKAAGRSTAEAAKKTTGEVAKGAATKGILQKTAQASRIGATRATQAVVGKQATRQLLRLAKGTLSRLPILGGLVEFGLSWALGDPVGKAAFRGVGTLLLGAVGSLILPGFGTFAGGLIGAELAGKLYELLFENKQQKGKVQKKQSGGPVTRGGKSKGSPTRTIKISRRKPQKIKPKQSQPGKDVGGKKKIRELYPDPSVRTDIEGEQKGPWWNLLSPLPKNPTAKQIQDRDKKIKSLPNSYKALTGVAKKLKDIPFGIGHLMGGAIDIALGEKLNPNAVKNLSSGISYLISSIANNQISSSIRDIEKEVSKMQTGGSVPRTGIRDLTKRDDAQLAKDINNVLGNLIQQKVDEAIREVQKQLMPGKYGKPEETEDGGGGGGDDGTPGARLRDGSNVQIEADLLEYFTVLYGKNAAIGIVANLRRESGYRTKTSDNKLYEGMAQWDRGDRWPRLVKWAESKGLDPYSRNVQAQYIAVELKQLGTDKRLKQVKTAEEAARLFYVEFERGANRNNYEGSDTEIKHDDFIKDISKRNPNIGKRSDQVVVKPTSTPGQNQYGPYVKDELGTKLSGDLGDFMKAWGGVPGSIWQHSRHGGQGYRNYPSYHNVDRAIDLGANADEQGPILKKIQEFNKLKGVRPVQLLHAGNDSGHQDHVHVAYQGGGHVPKQSPNRNTSKLSSYPLYSLEGGMLIAIQPIEKIVYVSSPSKKRSSISFISDMSVNNNGAMGLARG